MGIHTSCISTACPIGACCDNSTAACSVGGTSCPSGNTYMGPGSVCAAVTCVVTDYCAAGSTACGTASNDERIREVIFNTIDNVSGTGNGPIGCYSDFTTRSTVVVPGHSYPITVRNAGIYDGDQAAVWIDWNHNFGFLDTFEQSILSTSDGGGTFTGNVVVPAAALSGNARMRVRVTYSGDLSPCGNPTFGEVEDYTVIIASPGTCCRGATCNASVSQMDCTATGAAGAIFAIAAGGCGLSGPGLAPCCLADYNKVGGVNVQDIFDYLSDWFAGSPFTNTAGDGSAHSGTVQNIFDYLSAWFTGC
jgi:hypothetical protein